MSAAWVVIAILCSALRSVGGLYFKDGAYHRVTLKIDQNVPQENCRIIINNLEKTVGEASRRLKGSLGVSWASLEVLVPAHWPDSCLGGVSPTPSSGDRAQFLLGPPHPVHRDSVWTEQALPCSRPALRLHLSYRPLLHDVDISKSLVREWAKFRYGVFDELGYPEDKLYPQCYHSDLSENYQINGCSDKPISEDGACSSGGKAINISGLLHPEARTSLLFAEGASIDSFCNSSSHDRFAPTKHNNLCNRKSVLQVISEHPDFVNRTSWENQEGSSTMPTIVYKKESLTRYVIVIEDTKDMLVRESWSYLRLALRKWLLVQLQGQVEVGLVSANESSATVLHELTPLRSSATRDMVASNIPYTPGDSRTICLHCALDTAAKMLEERRQRLGPGSGVVLIVAAGMQAQTPRLMRSVSHLTTSHIRVAALTYPSLVRSYPLDWLAEATEGVAFTVTEAKYNMASSYLSTYFSLTNVLRSIHERFYQGNKLDLPIEIHRREIVDNGQSSVTGSFVLDDWVGEPAQFTLLVHNTENPLIRGVTLVSPSHRTYSTRSDALLSLKILTVPANINETGTWTYTIERFPGSPQPHYVQVLATPRSPSAPVVTARLFTTNPRTSHLILYTEVKRGDYPVLGAKVEVLVTKQGVNGSIHREKFELLDTGSGDPDIMKGDGIYSRYFSPHVGGSGYYTFQVTVTDNGNTAYSWHHTQSQMDSELDTGVRCCGASMTPPSVEPLSPFQRVVAPLTLELTTGGRQGPQGRVADLTAKVLPSQLKVRLTWTAPDLAGKPVRHYDLRYATSIGDILDKFDSASVWSHGVPFALAPGSETSFTMDFSRNPSLLDRTLYLAVRGHTEEEEGGISNWVRVVVPSPPPPPPVPTVPPALAPGDYASPWPPHHPAPDPTTFQVGLEVALPLALGLLLVILAAALYCYLCLRKKSGKTQNGSEVNVSHPEKPLNVAIVAPTEPPPPSSPQYEVRVPSTPQYDTGLRVQQVQQIPGLSPYTSWTASQLLHEHERRVSPSEEYGTYHQEAPPVPPLPPYRHDLYLPPPNQFIGYPPPLLHYDPSIQGSINSMDSAERRRRNVTMV